MYGFPEFGYMYELHLGKIQFCEVYVHRPASSNQLFDIAFLDEVSLLNTTQQFRQTSLLRVTL